MDAEFKKRVQHTFKEKLNSIEINGFSKKVSNQTCKIFQGKELVAEFVIGYLSSKHTSHGSPFGVFANVSVVGGKVVELIKRISPSHRPMSLPLNFAFSDINVFFECNSLSEEDKLFGDIPGGIIPFFESDDIEKKCEEIIAKINKLYSPSVSDFIQGDINAIADIFSSKKKKYFNYLFPATSVICLLYINKKMDQIDSVLEEIRAKKFSDGVPEKIEEVLSKLNAM